MTLITRVPVILVTGFLGSGKTTLLRRLLDGPEAADTAVVVNEIGEVGLDHHLFRTAIETTFVLERGCVCCSLREDLVETLSGLFWQRLRREIPAFTRVVVETTGLADPRHIVASFATEPLLLERFRLQSVVTTVDAVLGAETGERHKEWAAQIGLADTLLLTKADLATREQLDHLTATLAELNPLAEIVPVAQGDIATEIVWSSDRRHAPQRLLFTLKPHGRPVDVFTVEFETAPDRMRLHDALLGLAETLGDGRLLRAKGVLTLDGEGGPWLVEMVGRLVSPLEQLGEGVDVETGWMVFMTTGWERETVLDGLRGLGNIAIRT